MAGFKVCRATELAPGGCVIVDTSRGAVGVFNVYGTYVALRSKCPHKGGPLCQGRVSGTTRESEAGGKVEWIRDGEILRCPWHQWEFDLFTGETLSDPKERVQQYDVGVEDGVVVVYV